MQKISMLFITDLQNIIIIKVKLLNINKFIKIKNNIE